MSWIGDRPLTVCQDYPQGQVSACDAFKLLGWKRVLVRGPASNRFLSIQFLIVTLARSPTSLDVYLAAHILLLADPPFPDDVIQIELTEHYQELIDHARRVQAEATRAPPYAYELVTASQTSPSSLVPHPFSGDHAQALVGPEDNRDRIKSLVLIATTLAATAVNIYAQTFLTGGSDKDSEGDDGEGEEEEGLESGSGMFTSVDEEAIRRWQEGIRLP